MFNENGKKRNSVFFFIENSIYLVQEKYEAAVQSCTKSIELDSNYLKPYVRRAESYKQIDKLEDALQDYQKILELDPNNQQARKEVYVRFLVYHSIDILRIFFQTLPDQIKERNEKLKEEMLGMGWERIRRFSSRINFLLVQVN